MLKGGYLSWFDPASGQWWQRTWFGNTPSDGAIKNLKITNGNLRAAIDRRTQADRAKAMRLSKRPKTVKADALRGRAKHLRSAIAAVSG